MSLSLSEHERFSMTPKVGRSNSEVLDPWNWKMPSRKDTMSLSTLHAKQDMTRVHTATGLFTKRRLTNYECNDIKGTTSKYFYFYFLLINLFFISIGATPKVFVPKVVNKPSFFNNNADIAGSSSRALHIGL